MKRSFDRSGRRDRARDALLKATASEEPDIGHLLEAVPGMLARARLRRERESTLFTAIVPLAWRAIPRLAAATAILALVATAAFLRDDSRSESSRERPGGWLLSGGNADGDLLYQALTEQENGRG